MAPRNYLLVGGKLVLPRSVLEGGTVAVREGRIAAVLESGDDLPSGMERVDAAGAWVTPGLVEVHIHGAGGVGFDGLDANKKSGARALAAARDFLRGRGVTCFVPTLACREAELSRLAAAIEEAAIPEQVLPGIYLEGPFINPERRGGIPLDAIRDPDTRYLGRLLNLSRGRLRLMTLAPELPGSREIVARLDAVGVLPCLGHSDAILGRITLPSGRFSITHLFNAMSPFSHKVPGLAMLPFVDRRPFVELNADGVHVNEETLRICAQAIEPDRLILVSDAIVAAGLPPGEYEYLGEKIIADGAAARYAATGVLIGSQRLAPEVLRNWMRVTGSSVPNAVKMLTLTPAQALGMDDRRGAIAPGLIADMVIWEGEFEGVREVLN
jgi:N-acetylglucosamine-6-phosphate deacetylase